MSHTTIIDLFAGPGGWEEGLRIAAPSSLATTVGIEWDAAACGTAEAAGHRRLRADIAQLDPHEVYSATAQARRLGGLIASPPCQAFSAAGKKKGKQDIDRIIACAHDLAAGHDTRAEVLPACADERSLLVVEPLRWALKLRPAWIACEQVPGVLPLWSVFCELLGANGYSATCGVLKAEQYGVPQTRRRAILVACLDGEARLPEPTHKSYSKQRKVEPKGEAGLLPWVSMAEALDSPSLVMARNAGPGARRDPRAGGEPSGVEWVFANNDRLAHQARRALDEPAPTVTAGHDSGNRKWMRERPATAVMADARVFPPGHFHRNDAGDNTTGAGDNGHPVRVTVQEAAVLQSFPADYPWRGSKTKQFEQVGNAIPPLLAAAILKEVIA